MLLSRSESIVFVRESWDTEGQEEKKAKELVYVASILSWITVNTIFCSGKNWCFGHKRTQGRRRLSREFSRIQFLMHSMSLFAI